MHVLGVDVVGESGAKGSAVGVHALLLCGEGVGGTIDCCGEGDGDEIFGLGVELVLGNRTG